MKIQEKKRTKASILLVYTGGTIGMMQDPNDLTLKPFNFKQILAEAPELGKFAYKIDSYSFNPIIDSSDVEPSLWQKLAWLISTQYSRYDGFVILHGTDTMASSASALSFMLGNLTKPVRGPTGERTLYHRWRSRLQKTAMGTPSYRKCASASTICL